MAASRIYFARLAKRYRTVDILSFHLTLKSCPPTTFRITAPSPSRPKNKDRSLRMRFICAPALCEYLLVHWITSCNPSDPLTLVSNYYDRVTQKWRRSQFKFSAPLPPFCLINKRCSKEIPPVMPRYNNICFFRQENIIYIPHLQRILFVCYYFDISSGAILSNEPHFYFSMNNRLVGPTIAKNIVYTYTFTRRVLKVILYRIHENPCATNPRPEYIQYLATFHQSFPNVSFLENFSCTVCNITDTFYGIIWHPEITSGCFCRFWVIYSEKSSMDATVSINMATLRKYIRNLPCPCGGRTPPPLKPNIAYANGYADFHETDYGMILVLRIEKLKLHLHDKETLIIHVNLSARSHVHTWPCIKQATRLFTHTNKDRTDIQVTLL